MSLLDIYKNKNSDKDWFDDHFSLGKGKHGLMFEYTNTNFRTQKSFIDHFLTFEEIENIPRSEWPRQASHGQEKHKHMVVNMVQSKLFKTTNDNLYNKTAKGTLYKNFIEMDMPESEKWLINYLFLINGYYFSRKNYIINRVKEDLLENIFSADGIDKNGLFASAKILLKKDSFSEIIRSDFFYIHSFYNDSDFLINYNRSTPEEKEELASYIEENYKNKDYKCCISKKYQSKGNFNKNMLFDEVKVFIMTLSFLSIKEVGLYNIYNIFVDSYIQNVAEIDRTEILTYLNSNKNIFEPIFTEILEIEEIDNELFEDAVINEEEEISDTDNVEEYIDDTSEEGKQKIKALFALRKKQARVQNGYKCALETINNCKPIYFTSKTNNRTYVELHHFIPREFRNDFSNSIEVLANYVTLCPRCHRQIHLATDRERKHLINALFAERSSRLETVGLKVDLDKIYEYYKITD